jgi:hypothetical protein
MLQRKHYSEVLAPCTWMSLLSSNPRTLTEAPCLSMETNEGFLSHVPAWTAAEPPHACIRDARRASLATFLLF